MSYIRVPTSSITDENLPSIPSTSDEAFFIEKTYWKSRRQVFCTFVLCLGVFSLGNVFGWAVGAIANLREENKIDFDNAVMTSLFTIGAMISGPISGYLMLKKGRKIPMFCCAIITTVGWALIPLAAAVPKKGAGYLMYLGRFFSGFGASGCFTIAPVYVKEVTDDAHRAILSSMVTISAVLGNFVGFCLGISMHWMWFSLICTLVPLTKVILLIWIPETPLYLLQHEKKEHAQESFYWLTAGYPQEEREKLFRRLKRIVEFLNEATAMRLSARRRMLERKKLKIISKPVLRPMLLCMILIVFQQAAGANVLTSYTIEILDKGKGEAVSANVGTIIIGLLYLIFVIIATFSVDHMGRKVLLLSSAAISSILHIITGVYYFLIEPKYFKGYKAVIKNFSWLPVTTLTMIIAAYALGLGSVAWLIVTELNHPDFLEISGAVCVTVYWIMAYMTMQLYPTFEKLCGIYTCFWIMGTFCFFAILFIYFGLIETKGKTAEDIMHHYRGPTFAGEGDMVNNTPSWGSIKGRGGHGHHDSTKSRQSVLSDWSSELVTLVEAAPHEAERFGKGAK